MTLKGYAVLILSSFLAGAIAAGTAQGWRYGGQIAEKDRAYSQLQTDHATELKRISDEAQRATAGALEKQQAAEQRLADSDRKHTEDLKNAQAENARLADAVAAGERRLRVQARCPAPAGGDQGGKNAAAGGLGDDTTVELAGAAGRNVLAARGGILEDRAKIAYLQDYARQCQALQQP